MDREGKMLRPAIRSGSLKEDDDGDGGLRLALDTVEVIRSFDPEWDALNGSPRIDLFAALPAEEDPSGTA
jgi:hypothetical protein